MRNGFCKNSRKKLTSQELTQKELPHFLPEYALLKEIEKMG